MPILKRKYLLFSAHIFYVFVITSLNGVRAPYVQNYLRYHDFLEKNYFHVVALKQRLNVLMPLLSHFTSAVFNMTDHNKENTQNNEHGLPHLEHKVVCLSESPIV